VGLFERTQHLEKLAREIAEENMRRLGFPEAREDDRTKQKILEIEAALRECRLHLDEAEARKQLAETRVEAAAEKAAQWQKHAALAREKGRSDLALAALERASTCEREGKAGSAEAAHHGQAVAHLGDDIARLEHRVEVLRAVRLGRPPPHSVAPASRPTATRRMTPLHPAPDPLEVALEALKDEPPPAAPT
jgi:hypothetical protein